MITHNHHGHHHELIAERLAAFQRAPRRSGLDRIRRREAGKRAVWTMTGHLRCCHGHRSLPQFATYDELVAIHEHDHELEAV